MHSEPECCDGSDESMGVKIKCANGCARLAEELRVTRKEEQLNLQEVSRIRFQLESSQGSKMRTVYLSDAKKIRSAWQHVESTLIPQVATLKTNVKELEGLSVILFDF